MFNWFFYCLSFEMCFPEYEHQWEVAAFPAGLELLLPVRGAAAQTRLWSLALECHMGLGYFSLCLIVL